uniref:Uncharacterized protein n=1 Tax=Vespula pensylvanica TaxID=30213 RepID=A0A834P372_VESPE|nr:hypothetical protein H0235_006684 [Vespula pensylvanica]
MRPRESHRESEREREEDQSSSSRIPGVFVTNTQGRMHACNITYTCNMLGRNEKVVRFSWFDGGTRKSYLARAGNHGLRAHNSPRPKTVIVSLSGRYEDRKLEETKWNGSLSESGDNRFSDGLILCWRTELNKENGGMMEVLKVLHLTNVSGLGWKKKEVPNARCNEGGGGGDGDGAGGGGGRGGERGGEVRVRKHRL